MILSLQTLLSQSNRKLSDTGKKKLFIQNILILLNQQVLRKMFVGVLLVSCTSQDYSWLEIYHFLSGMIVTYGKISPCVFFINLPIFARCCFSFLWSLLSVEWSKEEIHIAGTEIQGDYCHWCQWHLVVNWCLLSSLSAFYICYASRNYSIACHQQEEISFCRPFAS